MRAVRTLLTKDLRVLGRSPGVLAALVLYPLAIAVIVGLVVRYAGDEPRIALVDEDGLPEVLEVGSVGFDVQELLEEAAKDVELVAMPAGAARRELDAGKVLGVLTIPEGFTRDVQSLVGSPTIRLETTSGGFATRTIEKIQALVYSLNQQIASVYVEEDLEYVRLLLVGGSGTILGNDFTLIGLEEAQLRLAEVEQSSDPVAAAQAAEVGQFLREATIAIGGVDDFLRAAANPIQLATEREGGRAILLSTQVQGYALALTIAFVALLLAAAGIASERDENVVGRLTRGLVRLRELVAEKVVFVALVAGAIGLLLAVGFGLVVELGDVSGGQPWGRLPVVLLGVLLTGAAFGALGVLVGVLAREARTATLVAFLVVLPIVLVGLVPTGSVAAAGWVSEAFPFAHASDLFADTLADPDPAGEVAVESAWLVGLTVAYGAAARLAVRRLLL
jgi:ABC-2 type transport system permease protein